MDIHLDSLNCYQNLDEPPETLSVLPPRKWAGLWPLHMLGAFGWQRLSEKKINVSLIHFHSLLVCVLVLSS